MLCRSKIVSTPPKQPGQATRPLVSKLGLFVAFFSLFFMIRDVSAFVFWDESFEAYSQGTNISAIPGFEDSRYWEVSQGSAFSSDGLFGISNYISSASTIEYTAPTPISEDFTILFDYKFLQARGYFSTLYLADNSGMNNFLHGVAHPIQFDDYSVGDFHTIKIEVEYNEETLRYTGARVYVDDNFEVALSYVYGNLTEISYFTYSFGNVNSPYTIALDNYRDFVAPLPPSSLNIISPVAGSEFSEPFSIEGDYNLQAEEWDKIAIWFSEWDSRSTCPLYGTPEWEIEDDLGWFHYGTIAYWGEPFLTPTGDFSVPVERLVSGDFNCIHCYFFNEDLELFSPEKCQGYNLIISGYDDPGVPGFYIPFTPWFDYYFLNSDNFPVPTSIFSQMADSISPIVDKLGDMVIYVRDYFDSDIAISKGTELGQAIPKARGYLGIIDDFIGLPLSGLIIFYFLTLAVVISYKVILTIIHLLKP